MLVLLVSNDKGIVCIHYTFSLVYHIFLEYTSIGPITKTNEVRTLLLVLDRSGEREEIDFSSEIGASMQGSPR
jgi:hypothetical protein